MIWVCLTNKKYYFYKYLDESDLIWGFVVLVSVRRLCQCVLHKKTIEMCLSRENIPFQSHISAFVLEKHAMSQVNQGSDCVWSQTNPFLPTQSLITPF